MPDVVAILQVMDCWCQRARSGAEDKPTLFRGGAEADKIRGKNTVMQ